MDERQRSVDSQLEHLRELLKELESDNPGESAVRNAEWRGRITAVVEQLSTGQAGLAKKVDDLIWKVAGIAATVSLLVALVMRSLP